MRPFPNKIRGNVNEWKTIIVAAVIYTISVFHSFPKYSWIIHKTFMGVTHDLKKYNIVILKKWSVV